MRTHQSMQFVGLASFEMLAMFRRGLFYAYLSIYLRHFLGLSVTETTLFATGPMVVNILSQTFIWGKLSDRFQLRRTLIVIGEILAALGTLVVWYAHRSTDVPRSSAYIIIVGLTIIELFWSMSNIAWSALVSDLYGLQERSRIQGRLSSMGGIGRILGIWSGGLFYDGLGAHFAGWGFYQGTLFFIPAAIMVISTIPLFLLPEGGISSAPERTLTPTEQDRSPADAVAMYLFFLTALVFINFGRNSVALIFPQYLSLDTGPGVDSHTLSNIINTQSLAIILLGWMAGGIGHYFGNEKTMLAATFSSIVALFIIAFFSNLAMLYLSSFLRGVADVLLLSSAYAYASSLIPPHVRAQRFAWFNATFFLSWGLAGTLISGPVTDVMIAHGHAQAVAYRIAFGVSASMTLIGLVILSVLILRNRR